MKKGRHRRFEEARALKRGELDMNVLDVLSIDTGVDDEQEDEDEYVDRWADKYADDDEA